LIPMGEAGNIEVGMAHNTREGQPVGFICDWVYVRVQASNNLFLRGFEGQVLPIPINHGEGRFVLTDRAIAALPTLGSLVYCDSAGEVTPHFPVNPNGAYANLAGVGNLEGNVLAMMPHPERANFLKQIPTFIDSIWADQKHQSPNAMIETPGPWAVLFQNMVTYCQRQGVQ